MEVILKVIGKMTIILMKIKMENFISMNQKKYIKNVKEIE